MDSPVEVHIRALLPRTPWKLMYCPHCMPLVLPAPNDVTSHPQYSWAKQLSCSTCRQKWTVCAECDTARTRITTNRQMKDHDRFYHQENDDNIARGKKKRTALCDSASLTVDALSTVSEWGGNEKNCGNDTYNNGILVTESELTYNYLNCIALDAIPSFHNFESLQNKRYFEMEHTNGLGAAHLVALSSFHDAQAAPLVKPEEVILHLNITHLLCSLTKPQTDNLGFIFGQLVAIMNRDMERMENKSLWTTKIPTSPNDMRSLYVAGKHSIIQNLPRPSVTELTNHAYVSLRECVADLLGHGFDIDTIDNGATTTNVMNISDSQRAKDIFMRGNNDGVQKLCLYLNEWSDAFEPSRSSKSNRGSCWIKTVTISPPKCKSKPISYTYPIAIGLEGVSHEEVEARFATELLDFKAGRDMTFYHGGIKKNVMVYLELFASLQDQPERRKSNYIMLGGSKFTARWGYSLDINQLRQYIPPCSECELALGQNVQHSNMIAACGSCVCWDVAKESTMLHFDPPAHFPMEMTLPTGKICPMILTYAKLQAAVSTSHDNYVNGIWTKANVECYLKVMGLNSVAITSILQCATLCKEWSTMEASDLNDANEETRQRYQHLMMDKETNPLSYRMWSMPAFWKRGVELHQHVDVVMHMIFLGVVRTTTEMVQEWSKRRGKNAAFVRYLDGTLDSLQLLGIDWCRCVPYKSGKFGGWVSENYLGASRLLTWLFGSIDTIAPDAPTQDPNTRQSTWNKRQNSNWLSIRGLNSSGSASELSVRVNQFLTQSDGPPPILPPPGGTVKVVTGTVMNLKAMIARIMCSCVTPQTILDVDLHIKRFLTAFHKFDEAMKQPRDKPTWITSYNFICLTNLPRILEQFGPVRNLWEGGDQGEKVIGILKPLWNGFKKKWQINLMTKALQVMAVDRVLSRQPNNNKSSVRSKKMFHKYKSVDDIMMCYNNRKPLSIVQRNDGKFGCVISRNHSFVEVSHMSDSEFLGGTWYCTWTISSPSEQRPNIDIGSIIQHCLLLPKLTPTGMPTPDEEAKYTIITSEWKEMDDNGNFVLPTSTMIKP